MFNAIVLVVVIAVVPVSNSLSYQIYHPNIDLEGNICLNILREDWKPVLSLQAVLVGLQYLFLEPNADDPLNKGNTSNIWKQQIKDMLTNNV